jgi:ribosomal protein S27AE
MTRVNPEYWGIRCKRCGATFTMADMLRTHRDKQRDAPPGMFYAQCPACGLSDWLTNPDIFLTQRRLRHEH